MNNQIVRISFYIGKAHAGAEPEQAKRTMRHVATFAAVVMSAIGGENVTTTIEGRERYPVNVRYFRELRDDMDKLRRVLVPAGGGGAGRAVGMGGMGGMGIMGVMRLC